MALFSECMPSCAQRVLDTADIVRDGDVSTTGKMEGNSGSHVVGKAENGMFKRHPKSHLLKNREGGGSYSEGCRKTRPAPYFPG